MPLLRSIPFLVLVLAAACSVEKEQALRELASSRPAMRARAVDTLARVGADEALPLVAPLCRDDSARVRRSAVAALGVLGPGEYKKEVIRRLRDADLEVRLAAVRVLGRAGVEADRARLLPLLQDPSMVVRGAAGQSLASLGVDRLAQARSLADLELVRQLGLLRSPDDQVRATAARQIGRHGRRGAHKKILPALSDKAPLVVREAARSVALIGGSKALPLLERLVTSSSPYDRAAAAYGIAQVPGEQARGALLALLGDTSPEVRAAAIGGLGAGAERPAGADLTGRLCPMLLDPDRRVALESSRLVTARSLACPKQVKQLVTGDGEGGALKLDLLTQLRTEAVDAVLLVQARALHRQHLGEATRWVTAKKWRELAGAAAAPPLPGKAKSKAAPGKRDALKRLLARFPERVPGEEGADPLLPPRVSASAVERVILGLAGRPSAAEWLAEVAASGQSRLRIAALQALTGTPITGTAEALVRAAVQGALAGDNLHQRREAVAACKLLGKGAGQRILPLLKHKDFELRSRAARCLGEIGYAPALPAILELLGKERPLAAIEALAALGDHRATPALATLLGNDHAADRWGERVVLVQALGKLAHPAGAAAALERELTHPRWQVRLAAARALETSGRSASAPALSLCREDYDADVRRACSQSLAALTGKPGK